MGTPSASLNIVTWSCSRPVAVALQDLARRARVHVDRAVADPIVFPLGLEAFDQLARDGRQQHVADAVLHDRQPLFVERDDALASTTAQ
jgi:hypothetical protein